MTQTREQYRAMMIANGYGAQIEFWMRRFDERYETRAVLAGAYVSYDSGRLTHVVEVEVAGLRPLCSKVRPASICDRYATDVTARATCPICASRDPRTHEK